MTEAFKMIRLSFEIFSYCSYSRIKDRGTKRGAFPEMGKVPSEAEADEGAASAFTLE